MALLRISSVLLAASALAQGCDPGKVCVKVLNNCKFAIWPGVLQGLPTLELPEQGGFKLNPGQNKNLTFSANWQGRVWARTGCDENTWACDTGSCKNALECAGSGGAPPASLAEFLFNGYGGQDYYDVSLVDGFNIPVQMKPVPGTFKKDAAGTEYNCAACGTTFIDVLAKCPDALKKLVNGKVVACKSACAALDTDEYCCRGAHSTPETCRSKDWPVDYPRFFKDASPTAYSYAYDDQKATFTCRGAATQSPDYQIQFC